MKDIKDKINQVKEENLRLMGVFLIVLLITFITVILVYFISLYRYNKTVDTSKINTYDLKPRVVDKYYDLLTITDTVNLNDKCDKECLFKTGENNNYTYYQISESNGLYTLTINILYQYVGEYNLGNDISNLVITKWNGYDTFKFIYKDSVSEYDEVIFVNKNKVDSIHSKGVNELELKDNTVVYSTYSCYKGEGTNAMIFKNEKEPFNESSKILSYEYTNLDIC